MIIDAHQHFWMIGRNDHSWPLPEHEAIYRDFGPEDLKAHSYDVGLSGSVLVQSQASEIDTLWLLEVASHCPLTKAVIGWTDLTAKDVIARIAYLAAQPKFAGLRPMLQGLEADDWILRPELKPALEAMMAHGLSLDALVYTRHLPHILTLAQSCPELSIIIDHAAKPPLKSLAHHAEAMQAWRDALRPLSAHDNVTLKLSGLFTEMHPGQAVDDAACVIDFALEHFGPERLIWGSDWPVALLRQSYRFGYDWLRARLDGLPAAEIAQIFGGNAARIYKITH
jgi:L-fuconolactonase